MPNNECRFYPVQCTDETFQTLSPQEGFVYFVTDKKKIYLGKQGNMIPMCATSGFFYGIKEIEYDNSGIMPDPNVVFYLDEIEGDDIPEVDDLILNKDGCFYRVKNVAEDGLETVRLTLQGSGGGGGGGSGGGGESTGGSFSISIVDGKAKTYASTATTMPVKFKANYNGTDGNVISQVAFKRKGDENPFYTVDKVMAFNEEHSIDIFDYKHLFNSNKTTVTVYVYDMYGTERSTSITVQIVDLELRKTKDDLIASYSNTYTYSCQLIGATSGVTDKKIVYTLYNENNVKVSEQTKELAAAEEDEIQFGLNLTTLPHGVYTLTVQASAQIAGTLTVLPSNTLTHKIAKFEEGSHENLLMVYLPEVTEQYTNIPAQYMIVSADANKTYTVDFSLDGKSQIKLSATSNTIQSYNLYFEDKGTFTLTITAIELNLSYSTYLTIVPYTGNLPVIDSSRDDLMLYLNPRNKSNSAIDRDEWADPRGTYTGKISGLHYGTTNGWLLDESGASYLKLNSGAKLEIPNFRPFEKDPTKTDSTDSRMGSGMTIEIDFEINGILDYDSELLSCISKNKDGAIKVGFTVTGNKVSIYGSPTALSTLTLVEGKRTRISFVIEPNTGTIQFPLLYGYLNGKISSVAHYTKVTQAFKDLTDSPAYFIADSRNAEIKIYGIRFYSTALSDRIILNNYTASLATLEERQAAYDSNNVYDASGNIDFRKVSAEEYDLQIPYMVLTGGYANEKESKWQRKDSSDTSARLPTGKKDYRMVDVKVVYPKNEYFKNYKDYEFKNEFKNGMSMAEAYGEKPTNGGAIMYAQGTSSMEYPVKNLRLRFKKDKDWYTVRPDIAPVEIICMKADYMESSGSHNTGTANFVDALYTGVNIKTPGQAVFGTDPEKGTIVTCIKGHPCLIFFSPTGAEGTYEYVGKYNLNLDKATPKPFGFDHSDEFGWLEEGDEYYQVSYAEKDDNYTDPFVGQLEPDEGADYVPDQEEIKAVVGTGEKVNSIHCFEFLDNAVEVCNFLNKKKGQIEDPENPGTMIPDPDGESYTYHETWYNTFTNKDGDDVPGWALGFESRYPEDRLGYHDADMLYPMASWINELYSIYKGINGQEKNEKLALARFENEYQCYLNKSFLLTYYLVTETLVMADSRVKNMMIATWGKENYGETGADIGTNNIYSYYPLKQDENGEWVPDTSQQRIYTNNYIFYPIFYDMDTMLGLDNTGKDRFKYYDDEDADNEKGYESTTYNGSDVLWTFVRKALRSEINTWYTNLEGASLRANSILPYYNLNQANMANEAFYNGDTKYKYIEPLRKGYKDDLNGEEIAPGNAPYVYAAQGDRSLTREDFINNRVKYQRGKYKSGNFQKSDRLVFRLNYPNGGEGEFTVGVDGQNHSASVTAVPPTDSFTLSSLKTGFAGVMVGANAAAVYTERFEDEQTKTFVVPESSGASGTEAYLLGISNLSDLGDLSSKYMQKFVMSSDDVRLKRLTLGNPHKDYYNPYWGVKDGLSEAIGIDGMTYLEEFNLQNCLAYNNGFNFSGSPVIEKILLTGSGTSSITLPVGGILNELRLPPSITSLEIDSHSSLTANNFSMGGYEYDLTLPYEDQKIGAGNGHYVNDFSNLMSIKVVDTPIDTYEIVTNATNLEEYCLRGINWKITANDTQYCIRRNSPDLTPEQIRSYYTYNATTKSYELWGKDTYPTENGVYLYERFDLLDEDNKIVCIPALEYLMTRSLIDSSRHAEALTGSITIDIEGASANELEIYKKYVDTYPDVKISYGSKVTVEGAYRINFYYNDINSLPEGGVANLTPYFSVLTANKEKTLQQLISVDSFAPPIKSSNAYVDYIFAGYWTDVNTNKIYYQDGYNVSSDIIDSGEAFSATYPEGNMDLVPHFFENTRWYTLSLYDYNYPDNPIPIATFSTQYEYNIWEVIENSGWLPQVKYVYRPADDTLNEHERYVLKGWISETDFNNATPNPPLYDLKTLTMTRDINLFAYYDVEDAREVITPLEYFNIITNHTISVGDNETITGTMISLKDEYATVLGGKITLPTNDDKGNKITILGSMNPVKERNNFITDIYFLSGAEYVAVGTGACQSLGYLNNVYLPETMTYICENAFAEISSLKHVTLSNNIKRIGSQAFYSFNNVAGQTKMDLKTLPTSLISIGDRAFCNAGAGITISELPNTVEKIGTQSFLGCENVGISVFGGADSALHTIGYQAFGSAGTERDDITQITINKGVTLELNEMSGNVYSTFSRGYNAVTKLIIGFQHQYGSDTAALIADLFGEPRTIEVSSLE